MEAPFAERASACEMIEKTQHLSFLGRRSFFPRPLSDATEIFDTDFEDDDADDRSPRSLDSRSTLSDQIEAKTPPPSSGLDKYEFYFEQMSISGPQGPHLFTSDLSSEEAEFVFSLEFAEPKQNQRPFVTLNNAVAELDESQVENWTPRQVADWMTEAGFEASVVDKFLIHDICGSVLLDLQFHDLKELDISSFGKRHRVMSSIQHLRSSNMFSADPVFPSQPSKSPVKRGRSTRKAADDVVPEESVSIVAIEQLLPKPHKCAKGEECAKWQKRQLKIQKLEAEFVQDVKSIAAPSVAASSDVLGPSPAFTITAERLSEVESRDPQDNVRRFLDFQHLNTTVEAAPLSPPITQRLNGLPKLTIPSQRTESVSPCRTPISALRNPTAFQARLRAELQNDPYHYGGVASPVDVYRTGTPMSATDIPVTAFAVDPCERQISQSVPPQMKYGESIDRARSTQPHTRQAQRPSFLPAVASVRDGVPTAITPPVLSEEDLANHAGWMRKRKTTRMLRHEWQDHYFNLTGSKLDMYKTEVETLEALQSIDVDDYVLHAYTTTSGSKLSAAFKKSIGAATVEPSFAFSLIPESQKSKKMFEKDHSHHFAVNSGRDRVEWMRKLMLAKAMKKNDGQI